MIREYRVTLKGRDFSDDCTELYKNNFPKILPPIRLNFWKIKKTIVVSPTPTLSVNL